MKHSCFLEFYKIYFFQTLFTKHNLSIQTSLSQELTGQWGLNMHYGV